MLNNDYDYMTKVRHLRNSFHRSWAEHRSQREWCWIWSKYKIKIVVIKFTQAARRQVGCHVLWVTCSVLLHLTHCTVVYLYSHLDCKFLKDRNLTQFIFLSLIPSTGFGTQKITNKCFLNRQGKNRIPYLNYCILT